MVDLGRLGRLGRLNRQSNPAINIYRGDYMGDGAVGVKLNTLQTTQLKGSFTLRLKCGTIFKSKRSFK